MIYPTIEIKILTRLIDVYDEKENGTLRQFTSQLKRIVEINSNVGQHLPSYLILYKALR